MTPDEQYQRRIDSLEWKPNVMTEEERLQDRRIEVSIAFEMMPQPKQRKGG